MGPVSVWLVAGFLCLGGFLRIYNFWVPSLWIDEYGTWWVTEHGGWDEVARRAFRIQGQSPFYYLFAKLSSDLLGPGAVSLQLPSILFGIGTLGLAYPLGMQVYRQHHAALLALAAFAVNDNLIWYSHEARPYAIALFCSMLSLLFYTSLLQTEKRSRCCWSPSSGSGD